MEDFYVLLGIDKTATAQEIKKAYRNKARELHPDANQGDAEMEEKFKAVSVAYEVLSDPEKRAVYDQYGVDGLRGGGGYGNSQAGGSFDFNLSDLFESFFGGGAGAGFGGGARSNSNDAGVQVSIELKEACFGIAKEVELRMDQTCETCSGSGAKENTQPITCGTCEGSGIIQQVRQSLFGNMMTQQY
jgi:molecular chaperone DnaJ